MPDGVILILICLCIGCAAGLLIGLAEGSL